MKYVGFALDELERTALALREDGAVYAVTWGRDLAEPKVKLLARLPDDDPPDSAAV